MQELVYQDSILTLHWDEDLSYHVARWTGFGRGETLRTALRACMDATRARTSSKWLANVRDYAPVAQDDQPFFREHVFPAFVRRGIRYFAIVSPHSLVAAMSTRHIIESFAGGDLVFGHFDEEAEAMDWLVRPEA